MTNRAIPFFNYPALFQRDEAGLMKVIRDVLSRGAFILQRDLQELEARLAEYLDIKHVFGVSDGTNALILGLRALGISSGDEVVVPSHTYVASAASIHFVGATPVLADMGPDHMVDPTSVEASVTSRTRAIMPVQLNGRTCDMDALADIARRHDLVIVEDAAQALGSRFKGRYAGTFGSIGTFSFYPAKVLGCFGDGGALVTNDDDLAKRVGLLRDHGRNADGHVVSWGTNSRLDNLQAAILLYKFGSYEAEIARRREIARRYKVALEEIEDLTLPPGPDGDLDHFDIYQNYELEAGRRDALMSHLEAHGIRTVIQWGGTAVHQIAALGFEIALPNTERCFKRCFMLPMNTALSDDDVAYVCDTIRAFYARGKWL